MDSLKTCLSAWEYSSYFFLSLLLIAAFGDAALKTSAIRGYWPQTWPSRHKIEFVLALLLVVGAAGELLAHTKIAKYTHAIFEALQEQAATADQRAVQGIRIGSRAHLRAGAIELRAAELKQENVILERDLFLLREKIAVRKISEKQRDAFIDAIKGRGREITLVLPDDQEARAYGDGVIKPLLGKAGFKVLLANLPEKSSLHGGLIICDNGQGEPALQRAFDAAPIQSTLFPRNMKERPDFCDLEIRFGFGTSPMRVFVGSKQAKVGR